MSAPAEYEWTECPLCGHEEHTKVCREWRGHTVGYLRECGCTGKEDDR